MINFACHINITSPSTTGLNLGFFVVIVKGHWAWVMYEIIDLRNFLFNSTEWNPGSDVDTQDGFARTHTLSYSIEA
jgi:hypothetical protein